MDPLMVLLVSGGMSDGAELYSTSLLSNHSGILGFMTLPSIENENILVSEKSKWVRKQKLTSNIGFFLEFFP